jgi:hypothetical protein
MLKEWSDNEPDPPLSWCGKIVLYAFLMAMFGLVGWMLFDSIARVIALLF